MSKSTKNRGIWIQDILFPICLLLIISAVFSVSMNFPVLTGFDDNFYVLSNQHLTFSFSNIIYWFSHSCVSCYLPVTMFSFMVDHLIWGFNGFGYHLQNVFWHVVAVIAIYKCFRLFGIKTWISFLLCLAFSVHPQRVESVTWISERKDVLCGAFYFLSIYFYIKNHDKRFSIISIIFFIISILSKPMAVSLPVVLLSYEFYLGIKVNEKFRALVLKLLPYFLILIIFIPITIFSQSINTSDNEIFSFSKFYLLLHNIYWYFSQTFMPTELNPIYPLTYPFQSGISMMLFYVGTIITLVIFSRQRTLPIYIVLPIAFSYIITLLPVSGLIKLGSIDHADRYSYIPSVFLWFSLGLILTRFYSNRQKSSKTFLIIILFVYSSSLGIINFQYQKIWKSNYRLLSYSASILPTNTATLTKLADIELQRYNFTAVLNLSDWLEETTPNSLMAAFYRASVIYHFDKKKARKMLLRIKPYFKQQPNSKHDWNKKRQQIDAMLKGRHTTSGTGGPACPP